MVNLRYTATEANKLHRSHLVVELLDLLTTTTSTKRTINHRIKYFMVAICPKKEINMHPRTQ